MLTITIRGRTHGNDEPVREDLGLFAAVLANVLADLDLETSLSGDINPADAQAVLRNAGFAHCVRYLAGLQRAGKMPIELRVELQPKGGI